jgi:broad specificity phosphatase PhoE
VQRVAQEVRGLPAAAIVSHGAVGTLLYCHLAGKMIDRRWDQPPGGGGNYFRFTLTPPAVSGGWQAIDAPG